MQRYYYDEKKEKKIMVNTSVPMSQEMMNALIILERTCFINDWHTITTKEVKDWLAINYPLLVKDYKSDFIRLIP